MKTIAPFLFLVLYTCFSSGQKIEKVKHGTLMKFSAKPSKGFNYDYLIFLPNAIKKEKTHYLLVETNNTGFPSDSSEEHERKAKNLANGSTGSFVSVKGKIPLLVPIFPRPAEKKLVYTHALDRDAIFIKDVKYERLDLQLLAMIKDAKKALKKIKFNTHEKVFMNGFSASGSFINRFALLHPEMIKAIATGGLNGILMLPQEVLAGERLNYPLGINDIKTIIGKDFNYDAYKKISQFIYMGKEDTNDAVKYDDAYNEQERDVIHKALSKTMQPDRWEKCQIIYRLHHLNVEFRTYEHVGHGTPASVLWEVAEFFKRNN